MSKEMKIMDLTKYYVNRYGLDTSYKSNSNVYKEDGLGTYKQQITRIIKTTSIAGVSLWDIKKADGQAWRIRLEDFERYCFLRWADYVIKNGNPKYPHIVEDDIDRCRQYKDMTYWDGEAEKAISKNDESVVSDLDEAREYEEENEALYLFDSDVRKKGYDFMLQAIYDVFYEPFKWDLLRHDMENRPHGDGISPEITGEQMLSEHRLADHRNYVGKEKQRR